MTLKLVWSLSLALLLASTSQAKLEFPNTAASVKANAGDQLLSAQFLFTNTGAHPIEVASLTASCGCLVPALEKKRYAPGESGEITAVYTVGLGEGRESHTITVLTNEPKENAYKLTFTAELPKAVTAALPPAISVTPRLLFWKKKPYEAKIVTVDLKAAPGATYSTTCDNPAFQVKTEHAPGQTVSTLTVTPSPTAAGTQGELTVVIETSENQKQEFRVLLRVLLDKSS